MKTTVSDHAQKQRVLFVCLGNICRSPAAEGIFRYMVAERGVSHLFEVDSAGVGSWHVGQLSDPRMRKCGQQHGYHFDSRARQICQADFDRFDHIIVMDNDNYRAVSSMASTQEEKDKVEFMTAYCTRHKNATVVPDPYYEGPAGFDLVIDLLEDACQGLLDRLLTTDAQ